MTEAERARRALTIADLRALAERRAPRMVFDYIDGGAEGEVTLRENVRAQLRVLVKRILRKHGCRPDKQEKATATVLEQAGLPHQRFHDGRHTCATLLLVQNVPARVVMDILGHSQISLTLDTYTHVVPTVLREAANRMDAALAGSSR